MRTYEERIDLVIDYIGHHIDEELMPDDLCKIACFSKYHFHRLFSQYTGVSLQAYIKWLRLKRAAHQLVMLKDKTILSIAMDAGYDSHEAFSRAFKHACGQSPSEFKNHSSWEKWQHPPNAKHFIRGAKVMNITIKHFDKKRIGIVKHHGDPNKLGETYDQMIQWMKVQPVDLGPKANEAFGFGSQDPRDVVNPEDFLFSFAITLPQQFNPDQNVIEGSLPQGRYATTMHKGSMMQIGDTVMRMFHEWLPESGEELGDFPPLFAYQNFVHEVAETKRLTEIRLLLK